MKKSLIEIKQLFLDETGVEPMTFCLQGRRATNYATRPVVAFLLFMLYMRTMYLAT
jgi:hypothetical protein